MRLVVAAMKQESRSKTYQYLASEAGGQFCGGEGWAEID